MNNREWLELIEQNKERIINKGIEAYKESLENKNLRYIVEMDEYARTEAENQLENLKNVLDSFKCE